AAVLGAGALLRRGAAARGRARRRRGRRARQGLSGAATMQNMALFFLVAVAMGGVAWVFIYPSLSGETKVEKRKEAVAGTGSIPTRTPRGAQKSRREQVEGTLKELEERQAK